MSLFDIAVSNVYGYKDVTPAQVASMSGKVRLVDVREPGEFVGELGHVPSAELVPLGTIVDKARAWKKDADVVLICRSGGRSARAAQALVSMGFTRVMNMVGGMMGYNDARLPVERSAG